MPISGATVYCFSSMSSISISKSTVSMASLLTRAKFCSAAVVNDGVKKNPEIQKMLGWPVSYQSENRRRRASRSSTYDAKGLRLGNDLDIQRSGTCPMANALNTFSRSADITDKPAMAFSSDCSDARMMDRSRLYRSISCASTVFMLCS